MIKTLIGTTVVMSMGWRIMPVLLALGFVDCLIATAREGRVRHAMRCVRASVDKVGCLVVFLGLGLLLVSSSQAWAGPPTDQLKTSVGRVIRIVEDPTEKSDAKTKARRASIRKEADNIFDFQETAKRSLGTHWQRLGEKDQQEFVSLFADLLEQAYISKIERYGGEKITYAGEVADCDVVTVKTRFSAKQGTEIPIDYRMLRRGDRWLAYDVIIEGVSLVANYRVQFDKIIRTASYAELVTRMKNKGGFSTSGEARQKEQTPRS
jgi:phospholipid transport system substrate-binding protein